MRKLLRKLEKIHQSWQQLRIESKLKRERSDHLEILESYPNSKSSHHNCNQIKMDLQLPNSKVMKTSKNLESLLEKMITKLRQLHKI